MKPWFIVTCRLAFDNEDSLYVLQADASDEAIRTAEEQIREEHDDKANDFFLNYVVQCDTEPTVIHDSPGA